jgi:hypothetical protein
VSHQELAAIGAFLSGAASMISAAWYVKRERKRAKEDCQERIDEIDRALREGIEIAKTRQPD